MTTPHTSGAADMLELIEAYAEARHRKGHSSYNAQTSAARRAVKAALAAGQATAAQAVVPAEWPTNEMIDAGRKAAASQGRLLGSGQSLWHVFRAMIAAAPAQPAAQPDPAYSAACNLATALFKKHFAHLPDFASGQAVWSLCDSTAGVISQIDNMVSGLVQPPTTAFSEDELE